MGNQDSGDAVRPGEVFGHFTIKSDEDADKEYIRAEAGRIVDEARAEMLGRNPTPEMLNEYRQKIGNEIANIPGVLGVRATALVTGNFPNVALEFMIDLDTGEVKVVREDIFEGKSVPKPPWARGLGNSS